MGTAQPNEEVSKPKQQPSLPLAPAPAAKQKQITSPVVIATPPAAEQIKQTGSFPQQKQSQQHRLAKQPDSVIKQDPQPNPQKPLLEKPSLEKPSPEKLLHSSQSQQKQRAINQIKVSERASRFSSFRRNQATPQRMIQFLGRPKNQPQKQQPKTQAEPGRTVSNSRFVRGSTSNSQLIKVHEGSTRVERWGSSMRRTNKLVRPRCERLRIESERIKLKSLAGLKLGIKLERGTMLKPLHFNSRSKRIVADLMQIYL